MLNKASRSPLQCMLASVQDVFFQFVTAKDVRQDFARLWPYHLALRPLESTPDREGFFCIMHLKRQLCSGGVNRSPPAWFSLTARSDFSHTSVRAEIRCRSHCGRAVVVHP